MACNTCAKSFTLLRREKACPGCGFSYCSKCLENIVFIKKVNCEEKVCVKCKQAATSEDTQKVQPPDAYYKRIGAINKTDGMSDTKTPNQNLHPADREILERLHKLKANNAPTTSRSNDTEITEGVKKIKGVVPTASNEEIQERLARLKGVPTANNKTILPELDLRTEQEQADDLIKQYVEQSKIDTVYKDEFDNVLSNIETRLTRLKGSENKPEEKIAKVESEDEVVAKIVEKYKAQASMELQELGANTNDELPFCEICNEDATLRCLGCKYLFCKRCYLEHKDDDDGCNTCEPCKPPSGSH